MDLELSEDQKVLQEAFASFFTKASGPETVRAAEPLGFDDDLWQQLVQTGAPTMAVPEDQGGGGAGFLDLVIVAQEFGKRLAPVPFVESAVAANVLARTGAGVELLGGVVEGTTLPTVALQPLVGGLARLVPAGAVAELVVALDGADLVALRRPGGTRPHVPAPANFGASPVADWRVDGEGVERIVLASGADAARLHEQARTEWKLLMAGALDGLRSAALDIGVDYVKQRWAFGVPIGWFQAIQHRLADVATAGDGGRLLLYEAAWARDEGLPEADHLAAMAFLFHADLALRTARESLQFHGGYGYTLEYDIQLYFRRAKAWPLSLGDPGLEYQRLADDLFTSPADRT